jgi:hypothetical protein
MRFKCKEAEVENLFCKNIPVAHIINEQSQTNITPATSCIPESLQRHYLPERRIKKIYDAGYKFSHLQVAAKLHYYQKQNTCCCQQVSHVNELFLKIRNESLIHPSYR